MTMTNVHSFFPYDVITTLCKDILMSTVLQYFTFVMPYYAFSIYKYRPRAKYTSTSFLIINFKQADVLCQSVNFTVV